MRERLGAQAHGAQTSRLHYGPQAFSLHLFLTVLIFLFSTPILADSHTPFTDLLQKYVQNGHVKYSVLCKDPRFTSYITQLSQTNPGTISDPKEELAFWINAYNAFTLKVICDHYPVKSINELHTGGLIIGTMIKGTIWEKKFFKINGEEMSLNYIEHEIVRKKFPDPRAHFALVCASTSCPTLRSEAYEGSKLDQQLEDQGRIFFGDKSRNFFEVDRKTAHLNKILDWYSKDFGASKPEVLLFVSRFLPDDLAAAMKADPEKWKITYTDYSWALNE